MKYSFIHGLWGIYGNKNKCWTRLSKCENDVKLYTLNPYSPKTVVYIFGEDNFKRMTDLGFDCRLIDKRPYVWDMETEQYRHKMEIWKAGTEEFDAITFLDFDCVPLKPIPSNYLDIMNEGDEIQTPIFQYRLKRVNRPPSDFRKVSTASFVYIRGKEHACNMNKLWEETGKPFKEEYTLTLYIDNLDGGWKGIENYRKHDPVFYTMTSLYHDKDRSKLIFGHYNFKMISRLIGNGKNVKERIDSLGKTL
jgi:hypothetical protein